ncbi:MAG TPA: peptidyl-prolyl cis-trans isomerase [Candidatus Xenobia bacterium]|jgi:parvulin-like peptidyl-prolyl isomerase
MQNAVDKDIVLARMGNETITLGDLLKSYDLKMRLRQLVEEVATRRLTVQASKEQNPQVSEADLEARLQHLRKTHGIGEGDMLAWLKSMQLTEADLHEELRSEVFRERWTQHVDGQIETYYQQHGEQFDEVLLSHLVVREEGVARELLQTLHDHEETYEDLVRRYAVATIENLPGARRERRADRGLMGSYIGPVRRGQLRAEAEKKVFSARAGDVVGPFRLKDGWELVKVLEVRSAQFNQRVREEIHQKFYEEWLHAARTRHSLEFNDHT